MLSAKLELTGAYLLVSRKSTYRKTWLDIVIDEDGIIMLFKYYFFLLQFITVVG